MTGAEVFDPFAGTPVDWDRIAGRPAFVLDGDAVRRRVAGQRVLVTGAAGSLGRPLAEALAEAGPRRLALYDHHESSLFRLRQALVAAQPELSLAVTLGDVRDVRRLRRVFEAERPSLVFHLAAYKHVPWGEEDPEAFVEANVLGARNVLRAAGDGEVEQIVYPSTDKAIDPPSLYGATKRLVEAMLQAAASAGGPQATIVRFVNVLGSQGSAPETFARQIKQGQPLTITHREMRRYWITPAHANLLLLHAACLFQASSEVRSPQSEVGSFAGSAGIDAQQRAATVAPDAGEEIAADEIARRVFRALRPGEPEPEIDVIGLRPGERLREPLTAPHEWLEPGPLPGLQLVRGAPVPTSEVVEAAVERIVELLAQEAAAADLRAAVFAAVRTIQSERG